jgi:hypothetical protein
VQRGTLGAQAAKVGRVIRVALDANDAARFMFDYDTAADAAVTTGGLGFCHCDSFSAWH